MIFSNLLSNSTQFYLLIFIILLFLVPGVYTPWGNWSACSVSCGEGSQRRSRSCTNPPPQHGGPTCSEQGLGEATEDQPCNAGHCPGNNLGFLFPKI